MRIKIWFSEWPLFLVLALLLVGGLLNQWSAGGSYYLKRQALFMGVGLMVFAGLSYLDYRRYLTTHWVLGLYLGLVGVLVLMALGGKRWLVLGPVSFQPSEMAKPVLIILLAYLFSQQERPYLSWPLFLGANLLILLPVVLIAVTDLDQAFLVLLVAENVIFLAGLSRRLWVGLLVAGAIVSFLVGPPLWNHLKPYQKARLLAFLQPGKTQKRWSYQTRQALIAVGSGGLWGQGFRRGLSSRLHYLPAKHTDLAFAVWAEEWGFVGSSIVVVLYGLLVFYGLRAAYLARDLQGRFMAFGCSVALFWQVFINLGGVLRILPTASLPLPFLSYGGSSVVVNMIMLGIIASVLRRRFSFL
ncbi:MAG TPA: rod shape-determining protein RodA [Thermosulfurimonas dismutans]|uniref:Rod shape-determining protein RodA n=1 Tax=Thermosulfurimonas dismutans TaxID=999894 RepID=A0A7C3CLL6_9BACT|nr:rod shape-determining protein RodA [Thermosulfurimonas dismutans]